MRAGAAATAAFVAVVAGASLVPLPAIAIPFVDPASGFKVDPPQPYYLKPAKTNSYDLAVVIYSATGAPSVGAGNSYLCQVGYKSLPDNADFDQEAINLEVQRPEWLENAAQAMSQTFDITAKATFVLDGATGIELVGKPKDPAHGSAVFVSMVDTPAGRTTLNCATRPEEIDKAVNQFRLIRSSITLPGTPHP
ncbi:MAG TPA: hypothetical protein VHB23_04200 [Devosiaceae bacterium]|nr:hypothetical protein [Devosiaceae bacterium]